jgi:cytochrome c-type biogenesis protein CcmH/NrfG
MLGASGCCRGMELYDRFTFARDLFEQRDYRTAARLLEALLADAESGGDTLPHRLTDARLLLARAYYHSAQLGRAEATARAVLAEDPTDAYAALLLARTLERGSRTAEAAAAMNLAAALGAPGTSMPGTDAA